MKKKIEREKNKLLRPYASAFLKNALRACAFLLMSEKTFAFDHYSVSIIKDSYVIEIDRCTYRERIKRNKLGYVTKDVIRRALEKCKKG
jgi:hypothetical protein